MKWSEVLEALNTYPTAGKDWTRIQLFAKACAEKEAALIAEGSIADIEKFNAEALAHLALWTRRIAQVVSNPLKYAFGDPFKGEREATRLFAKRWSLSDEFIKAMG